MVQSDQRLNHSVYAAKYNSHDSLDTETDSAIINMTVVPKIYLPNGRNTNYVWHWVDSGM